MSVKAIAWAVERHIKPTGAKLLLICLANYADDKGRCWPSKARLALDCSADKSSVCRWMKVLKDQGLIYVEKRYQSGSQVSSIIHLSLQTWEPN